MTISLAKNAAADKLAHEIIDLFHKKDVSPEVALHAMTRVMATIFADEEDVPAKIKALIHNLTVLEQMYRKHAPPLVRQ